MSGLKLFNSQNRSLPDLSYQWYEYTPVNVPSARDGSWGFSLNGNDFITIGWFGSTSTTNQVFRSINFGNTWSALPNAPFTGRHTVASYNLDTEVYMVGGDTFNVPPATDSWVYDGTTWTQKASDCGIGQRNLMGATYHEGAFYLVGGQKTRFIANGKYDNVLISTDNCASFTQIGGTTPFTGGNIWGAVASYKGRMWKICGGIYDDANIANRTYPREIYSSDDGANWTYEAMFPGIGRQYHQTIEWDGLLWVIGGVNTTNPPSIINLKDTWCSNNGVDWIQIPSGPFIRLHAMTCWVGADGDLHCFGGSTDPGSTITNRYFVLKKIPI